MSEKVNLQWFREHARFFQGQLLFDEPLAQYTYYRIGGPADLLAIPKSIEDLVWIREGLQATGRTAFILGQGSNVLFPDRGVRGLILKTSRLNLEVTPKSTGQIGDRVRLTTGSSVAISSFLRRAGIEGWGGVEFLAGIPGSVGGVIRMNAGTTVDISQAHNCLQSVTAYSLLDGSSHPIIYPQEQFQFTYRKNLFLPSSQIVWEVEWEIVLEEPATVHKRLTELFRLRKKHQPLEYPSCGSVFKNLKTPQKSAWQIIDQLGLRGYRIGDAQFSEKHCNFIINLGQARATDVLALIDLAQKRASSELGFKLETEVIRCPEILHSWV